MTDIKHTPGPWFVRDFRAVEMRRLGWRGPSIDRILITNKEGKEIEASSGADCVVARIQFDNRTEELRDGNLADARLIAAAPDLWASAYAADTCLSLAHSYARDLGKFDEAKHILETQLSLRAAIAKANGEANLGEQQHD